MVIRRNMSGCFKIVIWAFVLVTTQVACKNSSSGVDARGIDPVPEDQLITDHEEFNTLRYAYGLVDPEFVSFSFNTFYSSLRAFYRLKFPDAERCSLDKCKEDDILSAKISACDTEGEQAIYYTLDDGFRIEFENCSLLASRESLNGMITYKYLDGDGFLIEVAFDDFSRITGGFERGLNGKILASESYEGDAETYVKSSDRLEITEGDDHFVVADYRASISVENGRYSETVSLSGGDENRGMFVVTSPKELMGAMTRLAPSLPDAGVLLFKQGSEEMMLELAPGGDLDKVFLTINGENQTLSRAAFDPLRLFSLID